MKNKIYLALILLLAIVLRYYNNTSISLWHDEAFSALLIKYNWGEMLYRIGLDVHPPMYYIFLRFWHYIFGDSLLSLRSMTVFFSVGTVYAAWLFVKEAFRSDKAALWAAVLVAVNPFQVQYATEARMYTMGAFFTVMAAYFLTKTINSENSIYESESQHIPHLPKNIALNRTRLLSYLGFVLSICVMIYTHYYLLFSAAAICAYGLIYKIFHHRGGYKKYTYLILSYLLIAVSYIPWLSSFMYQYRQVGAGYWIPPMDRWSVPSTLWTLLVGFSHNVQNPSTQKWLLVVTLITISLVIWFIKKTSIFHKWLVLFGILAPFMGSLLFLLLARLKGSSSSVYLVRYFLYTSAFFSSLVALWLIQLKYKWLAAVLLLSYLVLNLAAYVSYWKDLKISERPGMRAAAHYLATNAEEGQPVFVATSFEFFNYKYYRNVYYHTPAKPLLFTGGEKYAKNISHFAGSAILTDEDLAPSFVEKTKPGQTAWLVWTYAFGSNKPLLPDSWSLINEMEYPDVRPYVGTSIYVSQYRVN
ncbi:MAG: glycosyltransferase family 39 protein [Candidatus Doudnabacteria bacterium]|nr:glycosyltransferase family 39 protein [Candidatus Doudnabacteria bacterium]